MCSTCVSRTSRGHGSLRTKRYTPRSMDHPTATVHPTAILDGDIELGEAVDIGPWCVLRGRIQIGAHTRLLGHNHLEGPLELGAGNVLYPGAHLGFSPQSLKYDHDAPGCGLVVGDRNVLREGVTVHRAMTDEGPTTIGNANYFMVNSHVGHDCRIGHHCVFANGTLIGGHVTVQDRVITGGNAAVHQFVCVGRGAMISGLVGITKDLMPWFTATGINYVGGLNVVGLRRSGAAHEEVDQIKWVYRIVCRSKLTPAAILAALRERAGAPLIDECIAFMEGSARGILTTRGRRTEPV